MANINNINKITKLGGKNDRIYKVAPEQGDDALLTWSIPKLSELLEL
jgi:hypothetical protein